MYVPKGCKYCGRAGHFEFACHAKPRKPLQAKQPMKTGGKHLKKWIQTRNQWLEQNKAEYYVCFYCPRVMTRSQLTLDHMESRSRHPELRYVLSNLVPCCNPCNQAKGSLSADEYIQKLKKETP
jgi:5-methylcytosine-specific restriction endonuclease McrA